MYLGEVRREAQRLVDDGYLLAENVGLSSLRRRSVTSCCVVVERPPVGIPTAAD